MTKTIEIKCSGSGVLDISELVNYQGALKKLSKKNLNKLKGNILKHGFVAPIFIFYDNGVNKIEDGNQRLAALLSLQEDGYEIPPIPVDYIHANSPEEARAILLSISSSYGEFDTNELNEWLDQIDDETKELLRLVDEEIDIKIDSEPEETEGDDDVPEKVEPITKLGDLWELGEHRLLCGDSTDAEQVAYLMDGQKADMVFTDPPYGIGVDGQKKSIAKNPKHNRKAHQFKGWDSKRPSKEFFDYVISMNIPTIIFGGNYFADMLPPSRGWLYWGKGQDGKLTSSDGELAWTNIDKPLRATVVNRGELQGSVHPTQKPLSVVIFSIGYYAEAKSILDLFLGSGSTLIACEKTNRKCYGLELDPHYCDVIVNRYRDWCNKNGKTPVIKRNGELLD